MDLVEKVFRTNVIGPFVLCQKALPFLEQSSQPKIVQITGQMGSIADNSSGGSYAYRISKAALNMFNKSLSVDYPKIASIVVHPGWVKTVMGGPNSTMSIEMSVKGILKVIDDLTLAQSGKFLNSRGAELPW